LRIRNFVHKGLKRLYTEDSPRGLPADTVDKLRAMLWRLTFQIKDGEIWDVDYEDYH
jgi:plasmid maintenance system killer protein